MQKHSIQSCTLIRMGRGMDVNEEETLNSKVPRITKDEVKKALMGMNRVTSKEDSLPTD